MQQLTQSVRRVRAAILAAAALAAALPAAATRVVQASPQGEVATVNQVLLRFDADAVAAGDPRAAAPFELRCNGQPVAGSARWLDARRWAFDLARPLAAGQRCVLTQAAGWQPAGGALAQEPRRGRRRVRRRRREAQQVLRPKRGERRHDLGDVRARLGDDQVAPLGVWR